MRPPFKFHQPGPPTDDPIPDGLEVYGFDLETAGVDPTSESPVGKGVAVSASIAWLDPSDPARILRKYLSAEKVDQGQRPLVGHNFLGFDRHILRNHGLRSNCVADTLVMSRLLNPSGRHGLKPLMAEWLGWEPVGEFRTIFSKPAIGKGGKELKRREPLSTTDLADPSHDLHSTWVGYATLDAAATLALYYVLRGELERTANGTRNQWWFYTSYWHKVATSISDIESRGVPVDPAVLDVSAFRAGVDATRALERVKECYGEININSPKQVSDLLYQRLSLPIPAVSGGRRSVRATKPGQFPTSEAAILELSRSEPNLSSILEAKRALKLGEFARALGSHVRDGRIYCQLGINTETGRLSSRNPNLQQIPSGDEYKIRRAFLAAPGHKLVIADYKALEPHLLAHFCLSICGDSRLSDDLSTGDVYTAAAKRTYPDRPVDRSLFKVIVLSTNYLKSAYGLAISLGVSEDEAQAILDAYFRAYPGIKRVQDAAISFAYEHGYVSTLLGRRRYLPEIHSDDRGRRRAAERQAVNTLIQGSAADVVYTAMLRAYPNYIVLSIHDEIIWHVPESRAESVSVGVKQVMENPFKTDLLKIKLQTTPKIVDNWFEAK